LPLRHKAFEGKYPGRLFAAAKDPGTPHIPSGEIGLPAPLRCLFKFDARHSTRRGGERFMNGATSLDAGLLIRREYAVIGVQLFPFLPSP
jgi:hypothetical protein